MVIKILLINFETEKIELTDKVEVISATLNKLPPLHDFHVIIIDTEELIDIKWDAYSPYSKNIRALANMEQLSTKLDEQTETGGWTFILNGTITNTRLKTTSYEDKLLTNDGWCPSNIKIVNEYGDTFYPIPSEIKYYSHILDGTKDDEISWRYYFSEYPEYSRIIAYNRANYPVFLEVENGQGKYVFLPRFKNRDEAIQKIINKIVPQVIQEESSYKIPDWVKDFEHSLEVKARRLLSEISNARKILFTKDRELVRASKRILEKLGFEVELLPKGTNADLKIKFDNQTGIIEVKGHDNRQENRQNVSRLFGYLSEDDLTEKGIFIANHEFSKPPEERSSEAYTLGAIDLAEKNDWALLSSIDLWALFLQRLEGKLTDENMATIRNDILTGKGIIKFS